MCRCVKYQIHSKMGYSVNTSYTFKNRSRCRKWGHIWKNWSNCKTWVVFGRMIHALKSKLQLEKDNTMKNRSHLEECVRL